MAPTPAQTGMFTVSFSFTDISIGPILRSCVCCHHNQWTKVKFLGVWDTVDALGLQIKSLSTLVDWFPFFRHKFHNLTLSESVEHARHALAIDDERLTFHPKIWDKEIKSYQTMKQVWFDGMHTDVGGGYKEQELSDIPFLWMIEEAKQFGLKIYPKHKVKTQPDADGFMHDSRKGFPGFLFRKATRTWNSQTHGKPVIHQSALLRKLSKDNTSTSPYKPWIFNIEHDIEPWPEYQRAIEHLE